MDKFEYKVRSEEISKLIDEEKYAEAASVADIIDWRRVKSIAMLLKISALYRVNRRIEDSRDILLLAYEKYPTNRSVVYSLCEVSIELDDVVAAIEYYKQFVKLAPRDNGVYTLRYRILEAQEASLEERIEILEELKKRDYQEEWGYELAYLYHRVGLSTRCVEECDDVILWFGEGIYVMKAMELKMLHAPLTEIQKKKYEGMKGELISENTETENASEGTYAEDGYAENGYEQGYTEDGYAENGYEQGYTEDSYTENGYEQGYTEDGYAENGYEQGYTEDSYAENGYEQGYTEDGYAENGYEQGYTEDGYAENGYEQGYTGDGYAENNYEQGYTEDCYNQSYTENMYAQGGYDQEYNAQYDEYGQELYEASDDEFFVETNYADENYQEQYQQAFEVEPQVNKTVSSASMDMSQYNTINLQKVVAESMKELFPDDDFSQSYDEPELEKADSSVNSEVGDYTQIYKISELINKSLSNEEVSEEEQSLSEIVEQELDKTAYETNESSEEEQTLAEIVAEETDETESEAIEEIKEMHTGKVAQMAEGVLEEQPLPNTGAIKKVLVPSEDARLIKEESDIEVIRDITEKKVLEEQTRMEANDENVYQIENDINSSVKKDFADTNSQMDLENVLEEWERIKQVNVQKHQEEVRQNVLTQTGKLFADFDTLVNTGVLGELNNDISEINKLRERKDSFLAADITSDIPQPDLDFHEYVDSSDEQLENEAYANEDFVNENLEAEAFTEENFADEEYTQYESEEYYSDDEYLQYEENSYEENSYEENSYEENSDEASQYESSEVYEDEYSQYEENPDEYMSDEDSQYYTDEAYEDSQYDDEYLTDENTTYDSMENESFENFEDYQEKYLSYNEMKEKAAKYIDEEEAEMIAEMAKEDAMITQEIKMNTADLSSLSEKILATTRKETKGVKREELREFSDEEQKLFENFAVTKKIKKQIINAMNQMTLSGYTGNVIITGEAGLDTVKMAKNLIRKYQSKDENFSGKVAKITGEKLSYKNLEEVFAKLSNGALIIEKANGLTTEKLYEMTVLLNQENIGIIIIVEDTKKEINKMFEKQAMIADYFDIRIDLIEMDINALVTYAKNYANALEYSIDDLGVLALYTRISNMQSGNHVVTKDEVRDIIDEAIWKSKKSKIKNFVDVLLARRYDEEDMIVLKERDFI